MREPTLDEMVEGIKLAFLERLDLQECGDFHRKPSIAWPAALQAAVREFLEEHKDEIIKAIAEKKGET
jgi:hypothetical protein